ncbi:MAG TPA: RluA family pseudouridine synthase [Tepidisphaeraceae bacterium]|nr:RluA family pseudouridine synthase [Tepidisphaeraceae bacterium]
MEEPLTLLYRSDAAIAVMKPAKLATIPGRAETDSVLERLGRQVGLPSSGEADPRLRVVHRLDKETTGVLLFATGRPAQQHFSHQFQNNTVAKEYLALVRGRPHESTGVVDAPLAPHPANPKRMAVVKHGGRPARTEWRVEEAFRGFALVRCFPKTGKTHQIRVHLAHAGMPLAIDPLYAAPAPGRAGGLLLSQFKRDYRPTRGEVERPLIDRLTLHAEKLRVTDPAGTTLELVAPLTKDFRAVLNQLRRHARG